MAGGRNCTINPFLQFCRECSRTPQSLWMKGKTLMDSILHFLCFSIYYITTLLLKFAWTMYIVHIVQCIQKKIRLSIQRKILHLIVLFSVDNSVSGFEDDNNKLFFWYIWTSYEAGGMLINLVLSFRLTWVSLWIMY